MKPKIDQLMIAAGDMARAEALYDTLLPLLGFDLSKKETQPDAEHEPERIIYHHRDMSIGLVYVGEGRSARRMQPGALQRLSFRVKKRETVDAVYEAVQQHGVQIVRKPGLFTQHGPDYYAFVFRDAEGVDCEIVAYDRKKRFQE